jgi:pimeloyl-ACP methyl ester carboxylesterase
MFPGKLKLKEVPQMPNIIANGIHIEYDTFGNTSSPTLLLIMGLGAQMVLWPEEFCKRLASRGLHVVRFDNRDCGLSSKFDEAGEPDVMELLTNPQGSAKLNIPYTLDDMAGDAVGLLDALGIKKAHVCGVSMGGMIAQTVAIRHQSRVLSLISISSGTGDPSLPWGRPDAMAMLVSPTPAERNAYIEHNIKVFKTISGSKYPVNEQMMRPLIESSYDRCYYPQGTARHSIAIITAGSRTQELKSVTVPALVIHGAEDPLLPPEQGKATAKAIPGAKLLLIEGMGHDLPVEVWPLLIDAIVKHIHRARP